MHNVGGVPRTATSVLPGSNGAANSPAHLSSANPLQIQPPGVVGPGGALIPSAARSIRGQIVVALYTYQGSEFGDMSFKKGDMMEIVDDT